MNKSTLRLFNDAGCHGNRLLLYSDEGEKKKGAAEELRGGRGLLCVYASGSGAKCI